MILPGSASVHAEVASLFFDGLHKLMRAELTALVGVHNLRLAVVRERLLEHIDRMTGLQRDGDLLGQYLAAGPVYNGREVDEPFSHRDVGRIQCPHLVRLVAGEPAQQVGSISCPGYFLLVPGFR